MKYQKQIHIVGNQNIIHLATSLQKKIYKTTPSISEHFLVQHSLVKPVKTVMDHRQWL